MTWSLHWWQVATFLTTERLIHGIGIDTLSLYVSRCVIPLISKKGPYSLSPFLQGSWNFNGLWVPQHNAPNEQTLSGLSPPLFWLFCISFSSVRTGVVAMHICSLSITVTVSITPSLVFPCVTMTRLRATNHTSLLTSLLLPAINWYLHHQTFLSFFLPLSGREYVSGRPPRGGRSGHRPATEHCQCPRGTHQSGGSDSSNLMKDFLSFIVLE